MDKVSWIDAKGVEHIFEDEMVELLGKRGFQMPPISHVESQTPFQAGSQHKETIIEPRDVDIPLLIKANNPAALRQKVRECLRTFNPLQEGTIKVINEDGSQREVKCRYSSGLEGNEGKDVKGTYWQKVLLVFRAFDPFWYDSSTVVQTFRVNESPGLFFPILPLRLASSTVFADALIHNQGDVETFPEWQITGPGDNMAIRNLTTGKVMRFNLVLEPGEVLTIDTKEKTVKRGNTNLFFTLTEDSSLWSLKEGDNSIQLEMANATEQSSVQLSYRPRYWGA